MIPPIFQCAFFKFRPPVSSTAIRRGFASSIANDNGGKGRIPLEILAIPSVNRAGKECTVLAIQNQPAVMKSISELGLPRSFLNSPMIRKRRLQAIANWAAMENSPPNSMNRRIWQFVNRLLEGTDYREDYCAQFAALDISQIDYDATFLVAEGIDQDAWKTRMLDFARKRTSFHLLKSQLFLFAYAPVCIVFSILPLPNVPFIWCLYRALRHLEAAKGCSGIQALLENGPKFRLFELDHFAAEFKTAYSANPEILTIMSKAKQQVEENKSIFY